jgi:putative transcriptional regulator
MSSEETSTPRHHPEPEDLLEYASGACPEWLSLMIACHLTLCPRCRDEVAMLDELGGVLLEAGAPPDVGAHAWAERLAQDLSSRAVEPAAEPRALPDHLSGMVPRALSPYLSEPDGRWRRLAPGIRHVPLDAPGRDVQLRLVELRPGFVIPQHGHRGLEWVLVLDGDLGDSHNGLRFGRGDVCRSDVGKEHRQDVSRDDPCIALVANLGPLVPKTLLGRALAKIVKI